MRARKYKTVYKGQKTKRTKLIIYNFVGDTNSSNNSSASSIDRDAVGSESNLFDPFMNQTALIGEMVQEFARLATIIQSAPIEFQFEGSVKNYIDRNNSNGR